jgi:hypothetical protein
MKRLVIGALFLGFVIFIAIVNIYEPHFTSAVTKSNTGTKPAQETKPVQETQPTQNYEKDIQLKISTDKDTYIPGEIINVTGSVENISSKNIGAMAGYDQNPVYISLNTNSQFGFPLYDRVYKTAPIVLTIITSPQLEPHRAITRTVVWDQVIWDRIAEHNTDQVPPGTYTFTCRVTFGITNSGERNSITTSKEIKIILPPEWITLEQAKTIALDLPEVKKWQEDHSGKGVVKQENGDNFALRLGEWKKVLPNYPLDGAKNTANDGQL